jgi:hypothetical protein
VGVGLEIEFEDDDSAAAESHEDGERRRSWPWTPLHRYAVAPSPGLVVAVTAAAVAVTAVTGLNFGRSAQQDRSRALLHLAPSDSYLVDAASAASAPSAHAVATANGVDRTIRLRVLNDGPEPLTMLGGVLSSPDIALSQLVPDGGAVLKPGAVGTLRALAHFVCGGGPREGTDATFAEVAFATVADIRVRTVDGQARSVRIIVQQYSTTSAMAECEPPVGP